MNLEVVSDGRYCKGTDCRWRSFVGSYTLVIPFTLIIPSMIFEGKVALHFTELWWSITWFRIKRKNYKIYIDCTNHHILMIYLRMNDYQRFLLNLFFRENIPIKICPIEVMLKGILYPCSLFIFNKLLYKQQYWDFGEN